MQAQGVVALLLWCVPAAALQPSSRAPRPARRTVCLAAAPDASPMSELMVKQHQLTLESIASAKEAVYATYRERIESMEERIAALEGNVRAAPAASPASTAAPAAPAAELTFLEYAETPAVAFKASAPLDATVVSVTRAIGPDAPGEIAHVVIKTDGKLPYAEGQSIAVVPPGLDAKTGKPHKARLYSIASSRYGDDGAGTSVSLCVRRAVYSDPETGIEDPAKAGVCSAFLCGAGAGEAVVVTGPVGKGMLLPEDDAADVIMVGTGTGVAPFRGFVKRLFDERTPAAAAYAGRAWLFFGGPTASSLLYPELWAAAAAKKPDQWRLTTAFSREEAKADGGKMYVQDRIAEHADELFARLATGAHLYLCGLKGMQPGIEAALETACDDRGLVFKDWVKALKKEKRYHVEVY